MRPEVRPDLTLVGACVVAVVLCFYQDYTAYQFSPSFHIPIDPAGWHNRIYPTTAEKLCETRVLFGSSPHASRSPLPVVADLDGDGQPEIVDVTSDGEIQIWSAHGMGDQSDVEEWPEPRLVRETELESKGGVGRNPRPIAMAVGAIWVEKPGYKNQKQIVVVDDGGAVKCYDSKLRLIWESHLHGDRKLHIEHHTREAAVALSSLPLRVDDLGAVIVGRRFQIPRSKLPHDLLRMRRGAWGQKPGQGQPSTVSGEQPEEADPHAKDEEEVQHFSFYAFDGATGALRWKHEAGDFHEIIDDKGETGEARFLSRMRHLGQVDWEQYKDDVLASLPHHWYHRGDTFFSLRHFSRRKEIGRTQDPNAASAKEPPPNVVVVHRETGLEVIHLYSGRTLCELGLPTHALHADVNGDGYIETVRAAAADAEHKSQCWAIATYGVPAQDELWNVSICVPNILGMGVSPVAAAAGQRVDAAPFLAVPQLDDEPTSASDSEPPRYAIATLVSTGFMSLINPNGRVAWAINSASGWFPVPGLQSWLRIISLRLPFPTNNEARESMFEKAPASPGLQLFRIQTERGSKNFILGIGNSLSLVDPASGSVAATVRLPAPPSGEVVLGDIDGDGLSDVLVPTAEGYYCFSLRTSIGFALYPVIVVLLLAALGITQIAPTSSGSAPARPKRPPVVKKTLQWQE